MDVDTDSFERDVIERSRQVPVVVDFWAPWCGPCRTLGPILEQAEAAAEGAWELAKLNTDDNKTLASRYQIQGIPAVKAFVDGEVVAEFVGVRPAGAVDEWLRGFVPDEADELVASAGALTDPDEARQQLKKALDRRPDHRDALLALAQVELDAGDADAARHCLAQLPTRITDAQSLEKSRLGVRLDADGTDLEALRAACDAAPGDHEARYRLAHAHAAAEVWDTALELLLEIVRQDRRFRDDGARKAMLRIFDLAGTRSETSDRWRKALAAVLF